MENVQKDREPCASTKKKLEASLKCDVDTKKANRLKKSIVFNEKK